MTTGVDRLIAEPERWIGARRVALLANQASLVRGRFPTADALRAALGDRLAALLTPEHGLSGFEEDASDVPDRRDAHTGLPVHSLYGPRRRPAPELLQSLDAVVVDLRDVGVRCYTYGTTVALLLEAARETDTEVLVCDRPSPLGARVDGPSLEPSRRSFLAYLDVPFQHGLTLGELARRHARGLGGAPLTVIEVAGWRRGEPDPGDFVPPSPGLGTPAAVALYPGLVALEGTGLSEGRGTPLPFQLVGGPDVDGHDLAREVNALGLAGVWARPLTFRPDGGKLAGRTCGGVQLHLTDAVRLRPLELAAALLRTLHAKGRVHWRRAGAMPWAARPGAGEPWHEPVRGWLVDGLLGSSSFREVVEGRASFEAAAAGWSEEHERFLGEVDGDLLYGPLEAGARGGGGARGSGGHGPSVTGRGATTDRAGRLGLGIDAGASSLRWLLAGREGTVAQGRLAPFSGHLYDAAGRADAAARLDELAAEALRALPTEAAEEKGLLGAVAGVTGLGAGSREADWLAGELGRRLSLPAGGVRVLDDIEIAFLGAFPAADGILVYAGTGAIAVARGEGGERLRAGGHGYLLDDDGGGFSIGRAALRSTLREADRTGAPPASPLARRIYREVGGTEWSQVRTFVYAGGRKAVAALAPAVAAAAREGDADAAAILGWAGEELARLARVLAARLGGPRPVALAGGVARIGGALEASFRAGIADAPGVRVVTDEPVHVAARLALEAQPG